MRCFVAGMVILASSGSAMASELGEALKRAGWTLERSDKGDSYLSRDASGGKMSLYVSGAMDDAPIMRDLVATAARMTVLPGYADPVDGSSFPLPPVGDTTLTASLRRLDGPAPGPHASLAMSCATAGRLRLMELGAPFEAFAPANLAALSAALKSVVELACLESSPGAEAVGGEIGEPLGEDAPIPGLEAVWVQARMQPSASGYVTFRWDTVLAFDDGTSTTDFEGVFRDGAAASRDASPGDWRDYRVEGTTLERRSPRSGEFVAPFLSVELRPGEPGMALSGCHESETSGFSSTYGGSGAFFATRTYCFDEGGGYRHDRDAAVSGSGIGGGFGSRSGEASGGTYRVDGHTIVLTDENGARVRTVFGTYEGDDGRDVLVIGRGRFEPS